MFPSASQFCTGPYSHTALGDRGSPEVAAQIMRYAGKLAEEGMWLDYLDAGLAADKYEANVYFVVHIPGDLEIVDLRNYIEQRTKLNLEALDPCDRSSKTSWLFLSCSVNYDPNCIKNHWIPCVFKEQVTPEQYDELTVVATRTIMRQVASVQKEIITNMQRQQEELNPSLEEYREQPLGCAVWWICLMIFYDFLLFFWVIGS